MVGSHGTALCAVPRCSTPTAATAVDLVHLREPLNPYGERLKKSEYEVRPVALRVAQELVAAHHYCRGGSNTGTFVHGLFLRSNPHTCLGVAWWIPPTKGAALATHPSAWQAVLALSRLVVLPSQPKNAASFLIMGSVKLIQADGRWQKLVTYADTRMGHTGGIYKATNWKYIGLTQPSTTWVDSEGRTVAKKAGGHTRTVAEMEALGYRRIGDFKKLKFTMDLKPTRKPAPFHGFTPGLFDEMA